MRAWSLVLALFGVSSLVGLAASSQLSSGAKPVAIGDGLVIRGEATREVSQ
jgi:hypothetical protein